MNSKTPGTTVRLSPITSPHSPISRSHLKIAVLLLLLGLCVRGYLVMQSPTLTMAWDHHEYVLWGVMMRHEGLTTLYDRSPTRTLDVGPAGKPAAVDRA